MGDAGRTEIDEPGLDLSGLRRDYQLGRLDDVGTLDDPASGPPLGSWTDLFSRWFREAEGDPGVVEPNAVQLATSGPAGRPSVRTVLAKSVSARGLIFYTNYDSAKGLDLAVMPWAAAVFAWLGQQRQVRFTGPTAPVSREQTERYFAQRPRGSQIGAWASAQSTVVGGRAELDEAVARVERDFDGVERIPPPPRWGGYLLRPVEVEFWQGRQNRMHDRIRFQRADYADAARENSDSGSDPLADSDALADIDAGADTDVLAYIDAGAWRIDRLAP